MRVCEYVVSMAIDRWLVVGWSGWVVGMLRLCGVFGCLLVGSLPISSARERESKTTG